MPDPQSTDEWMVLVDRKEAVARAMVGNRAACSEAFQAAGFAVEYALKAYIMRREGLNGWPTPDMRGDLYTHVLRDLVRTAGIRVPTQGAGRASWKVALDWQRNQGYDPTPMPRKVARAMVEAVFGTDGVVTWLRRNLP